MSRQLQNTLRLVICLATLTASAGIFAQALVKTTRVRGEIVSVKSENLVIRRNGGDVITVTLAPDIKFAAFKTIKLADIKKGDFVGAAALTGVDGRMTATEVHVFPETARGTGEGHRAFDLGPSSTMTNGAVGSVVEANDGRVLKIAYKGGSNDITVPVTAPVVTFIAADRRDLVPGKKVIVTTHAGVSSSSPTVAKQVAQQILVEKNGVVPPM